MFLFFDYFITVEKALKYSVYIFSCLRKRVKNKEEKVYNFEKNI